ncbi:MAG: bifunctional isocitrate dehydrogenase kinase/phosphatase [Rugosibacter sp.]|nr:MAG: bifunctional isocitrate dehydrogenase kinase/phosphatase [Rugosibacter sp.]
MIIDPTPELIAKIIMTGFNKHYSLFRECSSGAKQRFEEMRWIDGQQAIKDRIQFYDDRVSETTAQLCDEFNAEGLAENIWQQTKLNYIGFLSEHRQPELAETFFNSVCCRILHRTYFHNDYIFVRPAVATEYIESNPPTYRCYYPTQINLKTSIRKIFLDFLWAKEFEDIDRDVDFILRTFMQHLIRLPKQEANFQIQVLGSAFYRNKATYVIGKVINGGMEYPFALPILHASSGKIYIDTIILDAWRISLLFSLSRAYFMVDMEVPSAYVQFLRTIMTNKSRSELYTMLGLGKQGKTMFYRDLVYHLHHSADQFIIAPGIRGLVMMVFTLPSYPYVFKIIKDVFGSSKEVDHETVRRKYQLVKQVDRVGRMADTLEFSHVALPRKRFSPELIDALHESAPSLIEEDGDNLVIKHAYIERRMQPLNLFLEEMTRAGDDEQIEHAVVEYGNAIRELAIANIFPGDMLWKNFGITRYGRVVFYDYDEIEYMTDCKFRRIPHPPDFEAEMAGKSWYSAAKNDVFPEEFATFLLTSEKIRAVFMRHHKDILEPGFWQATQEDIRQGVVRDFFPYPKSLRFCNRFS